MPRVPLTVEMPAVEGGGLCTIQGERLILLDERAPLWNRIRALAGALAALGNERIYMVPEARKVVEALKGGWLRESDRTG